MSRPTSTTDRLFRRLEAAARGEGARSGRPDRDFVRRHVSGIGGVVVGRGVEELADRLGARAFTTDEGTIAMRELRLRDPENLSLLFHEHLHQTEGHAHGGEAEERRAQAREAFVLHLATEEGVTDVGEILGRLESERDAWHAMAGDQPGGTLTDVRGARTDRSPQILRRDARRQRRRNRRAARRGALSSEEAIELLLEAGYDVRGIVEALLDRWDRADRAFERERAFRFAGRTVL